ncbi:hypothetical protein GCM10027422_28830 [Hymenobacter arcticus]
MLLTLLLSGYIPPGQDFWNFFFGSLIVSAVAMFGLLARGIYVLRQHHDQAVQRGLLLIMAAIVLPFVVYLGLLQLI